MALPSTFQAFGREAAPFGVALALYPGDATFAFEIQRAPDLAGSPDEANAVTFYSPPGSQVWIDEGVASDAVLHYRVRHARQGYTAGTWSPWYAVKADRLPATLPVIPPEPLMDFDLYVEPTDGSVLLYVNGSPRVLSVKWSVNFDGTFSAGATAENTDTEGNADVATGLTAAPGDTVAATVEFYDAIDGGGILLGTIRRSVAFEGSLSATPYLDEDEGDLYLYPNRGSAAGAVRYLVKTDGVAPDKTTVLASGTLTTATEVAIHTFTGDGEAVIVGVVPTANADGSGDTGDLVLRRWTYHNSNDRPILSWFPYTPSDATKEGIRVVVRDDAFTVRLFYRSYAEGGAAGAYTDTGLQADPLTVDIAVTRPASGGAAQIVEFYAEDENGIKSHDTPVRVRVDGNFFPSGTFDISVDRVTGIVRVTPNTNDTDSGSYRFAVVKRTVGGGDEYTFTDPSGAGGEVAGTDFGTPQVISGSALGKDEVLNVSGYFYRTTSTTWVDQNASAKSPNVRGQGRQGVETGNAIRSVWIETRVVTSGLLTLLNVELHWQVASTAVGSLSIAWYEDGVLQGTVTENTGGALSGVKVLTNIPAGSAWKATVTPYTGAGATGTAGVAVEAPESNGQNLARWTDGAVLYESNITQVGNGLTVENDSGPKVRLKIRYGTGAAPGDLADGEIYARYL